MAADAKQMSKTERQTLIRLVKQRFKLLETGLAARPSQLDRITRQEVIAEHEAEAKVWKQRFEDEVLAPMRALIVEGESMIREAHQAGFERSGYGWHGLHTRLSDVQGEQNNFVPTDLEKTVRERMVEKIGDKPMSKYALELEESKLVEQLLVGDLGSDDAKEFLAQVPTLEGLIPLPNGGANKAMLSGDD